MRRYTTPTIPITFRGADLTHCRVWVTIKQDRLHCVTKDITDIKYQSDPDDKTEWEFIVRLTQEESARFKETRPTSVQINIIDQNGFRGATQIEEFDFDGYNLMERSV